MIAYEADPISEFPTNEAQTRHRHFRRSIDRRGVNGRCLALRAPRLPTISCHTSRTKRSNPASTRSRKRARLTVGRSVSGNQGTKARRSHPGAGGRATGIRATPSSPAGLDSTVNLSPLTPSAETPTESTIISIPKPDLVPLYDALQDCRANAAQNNSLQNDLSDEKTRSTALQHERDAA